ncbi:MAG: peptide-methionine (S)-S-oxide reductase MsrA [Methylacidiphilales bacterium]|nr:peptide-methionine (S)-S-oxide reductase MsrA [Candidatus Methylacidiphilales bacterium]
MYCIMAGGCFWCTEHAMSTCQGVLQVVSGYTGDSELVASYREVCSGTTKHREAVKVIFDETVVSKRELWNYFLNHIDPNDRGGQFADRGYQYQAVLYYQNADEQNSLTELCVTTSVQVEAELPFYLAEEYHQCYADKNPSHYQQYYSGSGREKFFCNRN